MFGLDLGNLIGTLRLDTTQYISALQNAERKLQATANRMTSIGRSLSFRLSAPILAVGVAAGKMAMGAEEAENLFSVSMGKMADATRAWSVGISKALHLNDYEVRNYVSTLNVMLESMGIAPEYSARMSKGLAKLTYDMSSFYNLKPAEAFRKIQAGITGEIEPLKRLGIVMNETTIKQFALNAGLMEGKRELTEVEKVMARYGLLMEQTRKAQGDMWRTLESVTNVLRSLWAQVKLAGISFGNLLLPYIGSVGRVARDLLVRFNELSDSIKRQVILYASITAAIGPLLIATGLLLKTFAFMAVTLKVLTGLLAGFTAAIAAPIVAVVALAAVAYTLRAAWLQNIEAIKNKMQDWFNAFKEGFDWLIEGPLAETLKTFAASWLDTFNFVRENFGDFISDIAGTAAGAVSWIKRMKEGIVGAWTAWDLRQAVNEFRRAWREAGESFAFSFVESKEQADAALADFNKSVTSGYKTTAIVLSAFSEATVEHLEDLMDAVKKQFGEDADAVISLIHEKINLLQSQAPTMEMEMPAVLKYEDMQEIADAIKDLLKETDKAAVHTMSLADAYRAMRGEMGRMNEEVYRGQQKILMGLGLEYEAAGVAADTVYTWYKEQAELLKIEYLKATGGILGGFKAASLQIKREIKTWGERVYEFSMTLQDSIARGLENSMRDFDNWKEHLLNIFEEIYWSALRIAFIQPMAQGLAGAMTGAVGGLLGGGGTMPKVGTVTPEAGATLARYQHGGLAMPPAHLAVVGEVPEAITPLSKMGQGKTVIQYHNEGTKQQITRAEEYMLSDQRIIEVWTQDALNFGPTRQTIELITGK